MRSSPTMTRRQSFRLLSAAAVVPAAARVAVARAPANSRITVGVVGLGSRGFNLIDDLLAEADAEIVAVCDVQASHFRDREAGRGTPFGRQPAQSKINQAYDRSNGRGVAVVADHRELCQRDDIDAIVVATPDHWHALCTMDAMSANKDVYCEKPVTHLFHEGQQIYRAVDRYNAVFQTGSQQRSDPLFRRAVEIVRNGHLGKLQRIEVGLPSGYDQPQGDTDIIAPPDDLDYDRWCGPASKLPYMRARHHRWWRGHRAFGGGVLMDWIGHHNDIAHWALDRDGSGPIRVEAVGWRMPATTVYNTPWHYDIRCRYDGGIETSISDRFPNGAKFIGEEGWLFVTRGQMNASQSAWLEADFDPGPIRVRKSPGHMRDFLDSIASRQPCIAPAETAHRSITPGHLGYVSHQLGRPLRWDASRERIVDDPAADRLLRAIEYRSPWRLPEIG